MIRNILFDLGDAALDSKGHYGLEGADDVVFDLKKQYNLYNMPNGGDGGLGKQMPDFASDETVIVEDSVESEAHHEAYAGVRTIWFDRNDEGLESVDNNVPDYRITSMSELPELIGIL